MAQFIGFDPSRKFLPSRANGIIYSLRTEKLITAAPASSTAPGPSRSNGAKRGRRNVEATELQKAATEIVEKISKSVAQKDNRVRAKEDIFGPGNSRATSALPTGSEELRRFSRAFINKHMGMGLVAKQFIPAGSIIYYDSLMVVSEAERQAYRTPSEFDALIAKKVAAQDPKWQEGFSKMPNTREDLGSMGGVWDTSHLPLSVNGEPCEMLGLNLAFTNHSCLPNSTLTLIYEHPTINGELRTDKRPKLGGAVVRNSLDIQEDQEITVSYFYGKGEADLRRLYSLEVLGFRCACAYCRFPDPQYEQAQSTYAHFDRIMNNPDLVRDKPAMIFQAAHETTGKITNCGVADPRIAMIWVTCALVAGLHSDVGRVRCFLAMAINLVDSMQGSSGFLFQRGLKWLNTVSLMPGFGTTLRGLSSFEDADFLMKHSLETRTFLFMMGAKNDEYIRLGRCRRVSETSSIGGQINDTKRSVVMPDSSKISPSGPSAKKKQEKNVKKQAAPKTMQKDTRKHMEKVMPKPVPKATQKSSQKTIPKTEPKKQRQGDKKKKAKTDRKPRRETCADSEHDFLTFWMRLVNDFIDHGSHEHTGKDKNTPEDSKSLERKTHDFNIQNFAFGQGGFARADHWTKIDH